MRKTECPSDADLIRRVLHGDDRAFSTLIHRHREFVYKLIRRRVATQEDVEDIWSETTFRVWRSLGSFDLGRPFRPWILQIAINVSLTWYQRASRVAEVSLDTSLLDPDGLPNTSDGAFDDLRSGMLMLGESDRDLLLRFYFDHLSVAEIADHLGIRPGAARVRLHRARRRLQRIMNDGRE